MQYLMVITHLEPTSLPFGEVTEQLDGETHSGWRVHIEGNQTQSVNVRTLRSQTCPLVLLTDQVVEMQGVLRIPPDALVSVMPLSPAQVTAVLAEDDGQSLRSVTGAQLL